MTDGTTGEREVNPRLASSASEATGNENVSADTYRKRARWAVAVLGARTALQQLVVFGATIYLARTLARGDYGIFSILSFAMTFFALVGGAGLAASAVQRDEQPDHRELSGLWWLQLVLALALVGVAFVGAPYLHLFFGDLPDSAPWLLRGLSLGLFFTMLRATPFLLLERHLHFGKISALEFLGTVAFYGVACLLAAGGYGAAALVAATVAQSAFIAVAANVIRPFRPALTLDWQRIKQHVRYGLSFQGIHVAGFVNGAATPLLVGSKMGTDALGTIEFARSTAWIPTALIGIVRRVSFPYFSRLQSDREAFAREFNNAIALCAVPVFYFSGLFLGSGDAVIQVIYSEKWAGAVPPLIVFSLILAINFFGWIAGAAVEALGHPGIVLRLAIFSAVINWVATVTAVLISPTPFAFAIGFSAHVLFNNTGLFLALRRRVPGIKPVRRALPMLLAGASIAALGRWASQWTVDLAGTIAWIVVSVILFLGMALAADRNLRDKLLSKLWALQHDRSATMKRP